MKKKYGLSLIVLLAVLILTLLFTGQVFAQPDPPALSSPAHGAFVEGPTVELEWEAPAGATHYLVWVYNLSTDQELYFEMVEGVTSFTVEDLPDNSDFIGWSVVAGDVDTQLWAISLFQGYSKTELIRISNRQLYSHLMTV